MERIFIYGTLQDPVIQTQLFGRKLDGKLDTLFGYAKDAVMIGGMRFDIAVPKDHSMIDGKVYEVNEYELARADRYKGKPYKRIRCILASGIDAWTYVRNE
jgi:gamma-glutamylcyclotransferase (GGCT)/AIG2-like uncharacterized protein YtfP